MRASAVGVGEPPHRSLRRPPSASIDRLRLEPALSQQPRFAQKVGVEVPQRKMHRAAVWQEASHAAFV
ncbi:hypothetical protein MRX96_022950 [Rhipicephalus microplus]